MLNLKNKYILITGAAHGLGKLFAEYAIKNHANLVLWDINSNLLEQTVKELKTKGTGSIHPFVIDLSDEQAIDDLAQVVLETVKHIDILFNNVGIIVGKSFQEHTKEDINKSVMINLVSAMQITRHFLPGMIHNNFGRIVNIASAAGMIPNPNMSVYAATKWAMIGWSESLRLELEQNHKHIKVTTVTPSYIDTGMFAGVKTPLLTPMIKPEKIAKKTWEGMLKGKIFVKAPFIVNFLPFFRGILPTRVFDFIGGKLMGIYKSMDTFKGNTK